MSRENILNIKVGLAGNLIGDTMEVSTATWCQHTLITDTDEMTTHPKSCLQKEK